MSRFPLWTASIVTICLTTAADSARGQGSPELAAMQTGLSAASIGRDFAEPPRVPAQAPGQFVRPPMTAAAPGRVIPSAMPFQMASQRPTISPYLNLYRDEQDDSLPNYFAFVLPQLRQQQFVHQQQQEVARIQQQLQQAGRGGPPAGGTQAAEGIQPHNYHARFMNTGHFFSGIPLPQPLADGQ